MTEAEDARLSGPCEARAPGLDRGGAAVRPRPAQRMPHPVRSGAALEQAAPMPIAAGLRAVRLVAFETAGLPPLDAIPEMVARDGRTERRAELAEARVGSLAACLVAIRPGGAAAP